MINVGIIGTGPLGSVLLAFFKKNGFNVFPFEKNLKLKNEIEEKGIEIYNKNKIIIPPLKMLDKLSKMPFKDLNFLIISVKNYDIEKLLKNLPQIAFNIPFVSVQNGFGIEDIFEKYKNKDVFRFVSHFAAYKNEKGKIFLNIMREKNYIGGNGDEKVGKLISSSFSKAGIKTLYVRNIKDIIWEKVILNAILNPLCAIFKKNMSQTLKIEGIQNIIKNILIESMEVAKKEGIKFSLNFEKKAMNYIKKGRGHFPSMFYDLKKRETEIDYLNGWISNLGKKHKIPTPTNDFITFLINNYKYE